jgi:hypothetical protein
MFSTPVFDGGGSFPRTVIDCVAMFALRCLKNRESPAVAAMTSADAAAVATSSQRCQRLHRVPRTPVLTAQAPPADDLPSTRDYQP